MGKHDDIIHHDPPKAPNPMPLIKRAAQFAPFAALTGYSEIIEESNRHTEEEKILSDDQQERINEALVYDLEHRDHRSVYTVFLKDKRKAGGSYVEYTGSIRKYDPDHRRIFLDSGEIISLDTIKDIKEE